MLVTLEAGEALLVLHSSLSEGLTSASYCTSPVNGLYFFFLLDLSLHFLKLMLSCFSNSYAYFHLRFHLPWFMCSPWGLSLTVNLLAQITSWTHQTNPTDLVFFSPCSLQCIITLSLYWVTAMEMQPIHSMCTDGTSPNRETNEIT